MSSPEASAAPPAPAGTLSSSSSDDSTPPTPSIRAAAGGRATKPAESLDGDPGRVLGIHLALLLASARYWSGVSSQVRLELAGWTDRAERIADPVLRDVASRKLREESFNAEAAAMLATLAPRRHRRSAVRTIVALEVLYDYLDGLTELLAYGLAGDGERLFASFSDAVDITHEPTGDYFGERSDSPDAGYLEALVETARAALSRLPARAALTDVLVRAASRGAEAQLHIHRATPGQEEEMERWAKMRCGGSSLEWREYLAGAACSVLCVHALVAAAADPATTREQAIQLDRTYLSISVLPTVLDSVIDHELDAGASVRGFASRYPDSGLLTSCLARVIGNAVAQARGTRHRHHHTMILVGVLAYYASAPGAEDGYAHPILAALTHQLRPSITPALAVMRTWRAAKRWRARLRREHSERVAKPA